MKVHNQSFTVTWVTIIPHTLAHISAIVCLYFSSFSWSAVILCIVSYYVRMFGVSGIYHRYFSHRTYQVSRFTQFLMAAWGCNALQRGPLWWASTHRIHHSYSDQPGDVHSPVLYGFWWSHIGWLLAKENDHSRFENIKDLTKYKELVWLEKFHYLPPLLYGIGLYFFGRAMQLYFPNLGMDGFQAFTWGFLVSTIFLYHGTFTVNSICHIFGSKPFDTGDESRNNFWIALITMGEGWHNNHHYYQTSEKQGMHWWQIDMAHYVIWTFSKLGIVSKIKTFPKRTYSK